MIEIIDNPYNKRLFNPRSLRKYLHLARFNWIKKKILDYQVNYEKVIELGCHDGMAINFLSKKPNIYKGYDANWENGIELARKRFSRNKYYSFYEAKTPQDIKLEKDEIFELALSLETLEHIPEKLLCPYLEKINSHLKGYFFITVPNEKGPFFLLKRIARPEPDSYIYNHRDYINLLFGRTNHIERDDHKGFDYDHLIYDLKKYFDIVKVEGLPLGRIFPKFLCFGIGIVAKTKF